MKTRNVEFDLSRNNVCLLLIDMQNEFLSKDGYFAVEKNWPVDAMKPQLENCVKLKAAAKAARTFGRSYAHDSTALGVAAFAGFFFIVFAMLLGLIQKALDMDGRKGSLEKKLEDYYAREEREPLKVFHFRPQLMDFERVEGQRFVEVLCPRNIYDLIDFSVRECLKQEIKMRVCKNCGHWFAITGRTNAEYCEVTRDSKGRTCKEIGAIALWNKNKSENEIFKVYRREHKKCYT